MVHHRGRRTLPAVAPGRMVRAARRPVLGPRDHAADLRGAQGAAVPLVFRRHPAPAHALALDDARAARPGESPERRAAPGLPGGRRSVVRRPAQPALLHLPARRRGQPGHRRRPAVPQAHPVPGLGRAGDGAAGAGPRDHPAAPRHRRILPGAPRWCGGRPSLLCFIFLLAGAANLATGGGQVFRKLALFLVSAVPVMVLLGRVRAITLLRRGTGASWRDAIGAFFVWQSTSLVVARASVVGLFAKKAVFLRTPKTSEQTSWWEALRANWAESTLALLGFIAIGAALTKTNQLSGPLLAGLLLFPTLGLAAAPVNSWAARRAALPAWLRERRTTEYRRDRRPIAAAVSAGGAVAVVGVVVAALALLFTGRPAQPPDLVGPAQGTSAPASPSRSPSTSPSATTTPTTSPSASPTTSSPTPSASPSSSVTPSASVTPTATPTPTPTTSSTTP